MKGPIAARYSHSTLRHANQSARLAELAIEKGASIFLAPVADDIWTELNIEFRGPIERRAQAGAGGTSNPDVQGRTARGERPSAAVAPPAQTAEIPECLCERARHGRHRPSILLSAAPDRRAGGQSA